MMVVHEHKNEVNDAPAIPVANGKT